MTREHRDFDKTLRKARPPEEAGQMDAAFARVLNRARLGGVDETVLPIEEFEEAPQVRSRWPLVAAAAAVVLVAIGVAVVRQRSHDPLFRVVEGQVETNAPIRTGLDSAVLALADESRIEMRAQSELWLERAADGVRIRLSRGSIIVNAAEQRRGHLYVQTRDVGVSVVGTVFLVSADEEGSQVAVIQGEVDVQQGAVKRTLLPGEQVASASTMFRFPLVTEVAWSRRAP
jgi:ferric-dicitrate binding protein FerR (iron transport regulator)